MTKTEILLYALQNKWSFAEVKDFFGLIDPDEAKELKEDNERLKADNAQAKQDLKRAQADNIRSDTKAPEPEKELTLKDLL